MGTYDLGIIDAQYILRRNWSLQKSNSGVNASLLLRSFYQSIMKLKREFEFDRAILCFDKAPYYIALVNPDYKADREYANEDMLRELQDSLVHASPEESLKIQARIQQLRSLIEDERTFQAVKYEIVGNGTKFGFFTLIKRYWEADGLAYVISRKAEDLGLTSLLITTDRDWCNFCDSFVDYSTPKGDHRVKLVQELRSEAQNLGISMYELGIYHELYGDTHNNARSFDFSETIPFEEFVTRMIEHDSTLPEYDKCKTYYDAMDVRSHASELDNVTNLLLSGVQINVLDWELYLAEKKINISKTSYSFFIRDANRSYL